jgi:nucleoid-associated protein YgaU
MTKMTFQRLDLNKQPVGEPLVVQFNPTEYSLSKSNQFAQIAIPGLDSPVVQFVRGDSEKMTLELFFDTTDDGAGANVTPVTTKMDAFYRLIKIDNEMHAPAIVRVTWGDHFPNTAAGWQTGASSVFDCVVESVDRKFTLFNRDGVPLRATVSLSLSQYKTLEEQLQELNLQSADHTRVHVVRQGETLPQIAYEAYQNVARWRTIAEHNQILNPRQLMVGTVLELPPTS